MKRPVRNSSGKYNISGKDYPELFGSRQQVWHGTAFKTPGGLKKDDLLMNKWGRIVSKKKHATAKKEMRLLKHGYGFKKGTFGYVKKTPKRKTQKHRSK